MRRILVSTDLSTSSDRAFRRTTLVAKQLRSSLSVVQVVDGRATTGAVLRQQADHSGRDAVDDWMVGATGVLLAVKP
ncbi:universal stress protein [Bosea beijingensis]|uniref:universal stress protein n=1 Tax=Bosea beijingensis TaxID=3068632 RepID=UPI003BEECA19